MELRDMLKRNVEEAKRKEQERQERKYQERIEEIKEIIEGIEQDMIQASQEGKSKYRFCRIDNYIDKVSYVDDIKRYFEERGFKVKVKTQQMFNFGIGVFDINTNLCHTITISWEE